MATFYVAVVVPYNASFVTAERPSAIIDVLVEALFFIGKLIVLKLAIKNFSSDLLFSNELNSHQNTLLFVLVGTTAIVKRFFIVPFFPLAEFIFIGVHRY